MFETSAAEVQQNSLWRIINHPTNCYSHYTVHCTECYDTKESSGYATVKVKNTTEDLSGTSNI